MSGRVCTLQAWDGKHSIARGAIEFLEAAVVEESNTSHEVLSDGLFGEEWRLEIDLEVVSALDGCREAISGEKKEARVFWFEWFTEIVFV